MRRVHAASPTFVAERALLDGGARWVAGVDEAGRGAWAGPVAAAAVMLVPDESTARALSGVNDSKKLSAAQREEMRECIVRAAAAWAVGMSSSAEIDALGILPATRLAMMRAVAGLRIAPAALLIDAVKLPDLPLPQKSFPFADSISLSVAAASILAKTARDAVMHDLCDGYGFEVHKGYGTAMHRRMLEERGPSPHHRFSFRPLRN